MATDPLVTYLNDHLAGSRTALQLLDDLIPATDDAFERDCLSRLRADIAADRNVLEDLIRHVGGTPSVVRDVGGWVAEKLARLKLALDDQSNGKLHQLETLEILALGIQGKLALWRSLTAAAPAVPALAGVRFEDLIRRAIEQHDRVEARRVDAARAAFIQLKGSVASSLHPKRRARQESRRRP